MPNFFDSFLKNIYVPVHFHLGDDTGENATTDGDLADKGALFVNVVSLASL